MGLKFTRDNIVPALLKTPISVMTLEASSEPDSVISYIKVLPTLVGDMSLL